MTWIIAHPFATGGIVVGLVIIVWIARSVFGGKKPLQKVQLVDRAEELRRLRAQRERQEHLKK